MDKALGFCAYRFVRKGSPDTFGKLSPSALCSRGGAIRLPGLQVHHRLLSGSPDKMRSIASRKCAGSEASPRLPPG